MVRALRFHNSRGFTFIELMVVVSILGILTAVAAPQAMRALKKAEEETERFNLATIRSGLMQYYLEYGQYPEGLTELVPNYLPEVPRPPGARSYEYRKTSDSSYEIKAVVKQTRTPGLGKDPGSL